MSQKNQPKKKSHLPGKKTSESVPKIDLNKILQQQKRWLFLILAVTFAAYLPSLKAGFINWDDPTNLLNNPYVRSLSAANIVAFFTEPIQYMYTPLVYFTWAIDYSIGGYHPFMYHFTNVLMHLVNVVLVFVLVRKLLPQSTVAPVITSMIFALHPLNVEGVVWVTERINVLMMIFVLSSLIFYVNFIKTKRLKPFLLSLLMFILACLSKSSVVIVPLVLLLFDWFFKRKLNIKLVLEKAPFLIVSLIIGILTLQTRADVGNIHLPFTYSPVDRFFIASYSVLIYLVKAIIPYKLSIAYAWPDNTSGSLPFMFYLAPLLLALLTWWLIKRGKNYPMVWFGAGFYIITLSINLVALAEDNFISDRYAYLILLGVFIPIASFIDDLKQKRPNLFKPTMSIVLVFMGIMAIMTFLRTFDWKDSNTIFTDSIEKEPRVAWTHNNRGAWRLENNDLEGAIKDIQTAIKLYPKDYQAYYNLGNALRKQKDFAGAIESFSIAIQHVPDYHDALFNRALTYFDMGQYEKSVEDFNHVIRLRPTSGAYNSRGASYFAMKNLQAAINDFNAALQIAPNDVEVLKNRGLTWLAAGEKNKACADMQQAFQISGDPKYQSFLNENCK